VYVDLRTGLWSPVDSTGDAASPTACVAGTDAPAATLCFSITLGTPIPEELTVTKTSDTNDGFCAPNDCSLREAVAGAENGDTIKLPAKTSPYALTYFDPSAFLDSRFGWLWDTSNYDQPEPGHLKITQQDLTIQGPTTGGTAVIQQTHAGARVFDVYGSHADPNDPNTILPAASVTMKNLTITGGEADNTSTALPSHIHGGGIHNHGKVTLENVTITGNHATSTTDSSVGGGGGIYNAQSGEATLTNVTIANNDSSVRGAGIAGPGKFTLKNTLIANNTGPVGNCEPSMNIVNDGGNLQYPGNSCGASIGTAPGSPIGTFVGSDGTYELLPGRGAVDTGTNTGCPSVDQTGASRPVDGNGDGVDTCDVGATEFDPTGVGVIHQPLNSSTGQPGPVTLTFDNVTTAGATTLTISSSGPAPPTAFRKGNPSLYYDLSTTAGYTGGVEVCFDYTGTTFANENDLRVFHRVGSSWQDQTEANSLDTAANVICARTTSFSVFAIFQKNQAPVAAIAQPPAIVEGGSVVLQGGGSDADGDPLTYAWSPATDLDDATKAAPTFSPHDDGDRTFTLVVNDGDASSAPASVTVHVTNAPPAVTISTPTSGALYLAGSTVGMTAAFTDAGAADTHTCSIGWDDGSAAQAGAVTESNGSGTCSKSHSFGAAGVYTVQVTVRDDDGATGTASTLVVVYDPNAGFVTGGGWFTSPAGAYRPNTAVTGRANFGFNAKYLKGARIPTGEAQLQFPAANLNFHSTSYDWLVVTGGKAQFKGTGTINGTGSYGFLLTVLDGARAGGTDRIRIKISDKNAGNAVVYDNVLDPAATDDVDTALPQTLGGGDIAIQK
jgi:hypothetical protein